MLQRVRDDVDETDIVCRLLGEGGLSLHIGETEDEQKWQGRAAPSMPGASSCQRCKYRNITPPFLPTVHTDPLSGGCGSSWSDGYASACRASGPYSAISASTSLSVAWWEALSTSISSLWRAASLSSRKRNKNSEFKLVQRDFQR
jgi:hypothetical protein